MRAITIAPGVPNSARLEEVAEPAASQGALLVRALALGVCATDREIIAGLYGEAPAGAQRLVLGHESFGEILEAPADSGFVAGDRVVGIVRRPDPVPCAACAAGEWDMCRNGLYRERGIKALHGFGSERFRLEPEFAVKVDPALGLSAVLLEPTSVVAKAWDHVQRIGERSGSWRPRTVLVTGAGPIGLLAAMMGVQMMLDVCIFDRTAAGPKPELARALGARYVSDESALEDSRFDVVMECTAAVPAIRRALQSVAPGGIVCLLGVSSPGVTSEFDIGDFNRKVVLNNEAVFGSVNANMAHYVAAAQALARQDHVWLDRLISRKVPLARWQDALARQPDDIKVVIDFRA